MAIKAYSYKNQGNVFVSTHFQVKEFAAFGNGKLYTDSVLIDNDLVNYLERIFSKLNCKKAIISSGYRDPACDRAVGGSGVGQHVNGRAADICYYDKSNKPIPSKIVVCVAYDLGMPGIATIDNNYSHLDTRTAGTYRGNETIGNSNYYTNPYTYFGVSPADVAKYTGESVSAPSQPSQTNVNVYYRVKTQGYNWLPAVRNLADYAGYNNDPITAVAIKVDKGSVKYRVHLKGKGWLDYVTGYDVGDIKNGYAGNGRDVIDAIEIYYNTPNNIRPYKKARYKVNNYSWQKDNEKTQGQDGYAGMFGVPVTKLQIIIE